MASMSSMACQLSVIFNVMSKPESQRNIMAAMKAKLKMKMAALSW
jgi:hypothetical protein